MKLKTQRLLQEAKDRVDDEGELVEVDHGEAKQMNEYKIKTITDFLNVPDDRIDDCLIEFKSFLEYMKPLIDVAKMGAKAIGQDPEKALEFISFTWVDDGKTDVTIRMNVVRDKGEAK